ncbi:unnamed protein product [Nezara viridula]|uniref:Uncharacterized protein n=1 Tax=Nezara viridula TaxID=85310 RepID=A0A9P0H393_NEZVI|nr:unnamed protein product [Nezara viridula]
MSLIPLNENISIPQSSSSISETPPVHKNVPEVASDNFDDSPSSKEEPIVRPSTASTSVEIDDTQGEEKHLTHSSRGADYTPASCESPFYSSTEIYGHPRHGSASNQLQELSVTRCGSLPIAHSF